MDMGCTKVGAISGSINTAGLTGAYIRTVFLGYLALSFGYYLPVLYTGIMVLMGSFIWLKINATQKIQFKSISK